jgi:crossover junction endodeoxyribonuclease RuvC
LNVIILGVDPGYAITGFGVVEHDGQRFKTLDFGTIETPAGMPFPERLLAIDQGIDSLIRTYQPGCVAVEELFFYRNTTTAMGTAQARGVAVVAAARVRLPVHEYTPMQVKLAVTGYGHAEKTQVQEMVRILLNLKEIPKPDDAADALAVAICHAHTGNLDSTRAVGGYQKRPSKRQWR